MKILRSVSIRKALDPTIKYEGWREITPDYATIYLLKVLGKQTRYIKPGESAIEILYLMDVLEEREDTIPVHKWCQSTENLMAFFIGHQAKAQRSNDDIDSTPSP